MRALEAAFPNGDFPAVSVFEVGGAYFVSDGHHRVALAHERRQEFIEAEVVKLATGWELAKRLGRLPSPEELGNSWLTEVYQPGLRALNVAGLSCPHEGATEADSFLWLYQRRRALWMRGTRASYRDAVYDIRHPRRLSRRERRRLRKAAEGLPTAETQELVNA